MWSQEDSLIMILLIVVWCVIAIYFIKKDYRGGRF